MRKGVEITGLSQNFIPLSKTGWQKSRRLPTAGLDEILEKALTQLGTSKYQLAMLLGLPQPTIQFRQWTSGRTSIGALYLARLLYLVLLQNRLVGRNKSFSMVKKIDWERGVAEVRTGFAEQFGEKLLTPLQPPPKPSPVYKKDLLGLRKPKKTPIELQKRPSPSYRSVSIHRTPEEIERVLKEKLGEVISDNTSITIPVIKEEDRGVVASRGYPEF